MFFLNMYSLKGLSAWQFPWTWTDCLRGGGQSRIITIAQKIKRRWFLYCQFPLNVHISAYWKRFVITVTWTAATYTQVVICCELKKCWNGRQKHKNRQRAAPVLLSYWVISMSVWWCIRVQIFFNDRCATVVFLKQWFSKVPPSGAGSVFKLIISITCRIDMLLIKEFTSK